MGEKKELKPETLEEQVKELRQKILPLLELCIPSEEVRKEIKKNLITAQISLLKVFKTLLDYQIKVLERLASEERTAGEESRKGKTQKIQRIKLD
jgi:hypothetical protein